MTDPPYPRYWSDRLAIRLRPVDPAGDMSLRARAWRAAVDWGWGRYLDTPLRRRLLWVWRRFRS